VVTVAAALLSMSLVAASCSDDKDKAAPSSAASTTAAPASTPSSAPTDSTTAPSASSAPDTTAKDAGKPVKGGEAEILLYSEVGTLDPVRFTGSGGSDAQRAFALYGALVTYNDATKKSEPVLAESIEPNADFTKWTLKLKPGIKFSDGVAYDAEAVKANMERAKDVANRSPAFTSMMAVTALTVVDPLTLEITLASGNAHFPATISRSGVNYIASPKAIADKVDMTSQAVGAGPYLLESWTRDDRMIMKANPDWKGSDGPFLDKLTFRVMGDEQQRVDAFDTGDADGFYTATPESVRKATEAVKDSSYTSVRTTTGQVYVFNLTKPPFDDIRVRKIFAMGVDWQALAEDVFGPGSAAPYNFTVEDTDFYTPDAALPKYDAAETQKLIDEYTAEKGGGPLVINLNGFQQSLDQARAEYIQTALGQYNNIEVKLTINDSPTAIGLVLKGEYDVNSWGFPVTSPDPGIYNSVFSKSLNNYAKYNNPDVDALLMAARVNPDPAKALEDYKKVFVQLAKDIPFYPYLKTRNGFVTSPKLHGAAVYEDGILRTDLLWKEA